MIYRTLITLPLLALAAYGQEPYSKLRATGPQTLAIAYRCNPDQRANLRQTMIAGGVARFEGWKKQGILKDYHILFNNYLDSETYDLLTLLTFHDFSSVNRWKEIERTAPGGLSNEALKLVTSAITYSLDTVRHGTSKEPPKLGQSVYFIIPYDYVIGTDDYVRYLDTYVIPQVNGWMEENVLASYSIYLSRYSTARAWGSLFVLEYRDHDAFGKRESTVAKVREKLKTNAEWLATSENKQKIRVEKQTIIAEELLPK
jgi:hypothetical protein